MLLDNIWKARAFDDDDDDDNWTMTDQDVDDDHSTRYEVVQRSLMDGRRN